MIKGIIILGGIIVFVGALNIYFIKMLFEDPEDALLDHGLENIVILAIVDILGFVVIRACLEVWFGVQL